MVWEIHGPRGKYLAGKYAAIEIPGKFLAGKFLGVNLPIRLFGRMDLYTELSFLVVTEFSRAFSPSLLLPFTKGNIIILGYSPET